MRLVWQAWNAYLRRASAYQATVLLNALYFAIFGPSVLVARVFGVRRVSVTEVLKPLQEAGLIHNGRGTVTVLNRKGLEAASCECYRIATAKKDRFDGIQR